MVEDRDKIKNLSHVLLQLNRERDESDPGIHV